MQISTARHEHASPSAHPAVPDARLHLATRTPDGSHTGDALYQRWSHGDLVRLHRAVYADARTWLTDAPWERHAAVMAARALAEPATVFVRQSALAIWGVEQHWAWDEVHVRASQASTVGRRAPVRAWPDDRVAARALAQAVPEEARGYRVPTVPGLVHVRGYPEWLVEAPRRVSAAVALSRWGVTSPLAHRDDSGRGFLVLMVDPLELAVADVICRSELMTSLAVVDSVISGRWSGRRPVAKEEILSWVDLVPIRRKRERAQLALELGDPASESIGESMSRARMWEAGLQMPSLQVEFVLDDGRLIRVDNFWRELGLVGEFDGKSKYTRSIHISGQAAGEVVFEEKKREDALRRRGLRVIRWTFEDVIQPERLGRMLRNAGVPLRG